MPPMPPPDQQDQPRDEREQPFARWMGGDGSPPWMRGDGAPWMHGGRGSWRQHRRRRGRRLFVRFALVFGIITLLILGGMALLARLATQLVGGDGQVTGVVWLLSCGLVDCVAADGGRHRRRAFRSIARPLGDVMEAADAVAAGDLSARVPERGSKEFRQLAHSFNRMASGLEMSDQQRRNLMADVAHELRTPLHIIQGNLEGVLDGVYEPTPEHVAATLDETRLLARLVEDLRVLSLAEAGHLPMEMERVDVAELLEDVATSFSGQAETAGVRLAVEVTGQREDLIVTGDAGRLDQVIGNLVANALRHTPRDGTITLQAQPLPESVQISVSDTGNGIPPEELPTSSTASGRVPRAAAAAWGWPSRAVSFRHTVGGSKFRAKRGRARPSPSSCLASQTGRSH